MPSDREIEGSLSGRGILFTCMCPLSAVLIPEPALRSSWARQPQSKLWAFTGRAAYKIGAAASRLCEWNTVWEGVSSVLRLIHQPKWCNTHPGCPRHTGICYFPKCRLASWWRSWLCRVWSQRSRKNRCYKAWLSLPCMYVIGETGAQMCTGRQLICCPGYGTL